MAYTTIDKPSQYFDTQLWTGDNGNGRTFTGLGFQPNLIWSKCRNSSNYNHVWVDRVRGGSYFLFSNTTAAEDNKSHGEITSWNSDGSTWINGTNVTYPRAYYNDGAGSALGGSTYVSWNWKAGDSAGSSNTNGSITSTVSASQTSGFSIVSYTGTATAGATVGHGLGVVPSMIITKARTIADNWGVYHKSLGATKALYLNTTNAQITSSAYYNNTAPSSTVVTLGDNEATNDNAGMIMYAFAEVKGFSKFSSYTGNGSTDGTFIYTGFKPAYVLVKNTTTAGNSWAVFDNKRLGYNVSNLALFPSDTGAETSGTSYIDILSNGFKMRSANDFNNKNGDTYIYMAFAENPFVSSTLIPTTAR